MATAVRRATQKRHKNKKMEKKDRNKLFEHIPSCAAEFIRFVIRKDGTLGAVELLRTSGQRLLDRAAMEALRDGAPYWPLPEDWDTNSLTVTGHFIYTLHGYYVR